MDSLSMMEKMDDFPLTHITKGISKKLYEMKNTDDFQGINKLGIQLRSLIMEARSALYGKAQDEEFKANYAEFKKRALNLSNRVDEFEEKHLKYNIPSLIGVQSFKIYLQNLQEFMKIWEKEAEKGREKGEKSLIEWLKNLDQSQRKSTIEEMNKVVIDLGIHISVIMIEFLSLVVIFGDRNNIMKNVDDFKDMIKILSVEKNKENSIVIKNFLCVIELVGRRMRKRKGLGVNRGKECEISGGDVELKIARMILKEILRVEVGFCCPDLVMVLSDEMYLSMGTHLRNFFGNKLTELSLKVNDLKIQADEQDFDMIKEEKRFKIAKETIIDGVHNIWNKFHLNSSTTSLFFEIDQPL
ncbi:hypothetical protein CsatB_002039 [Cannabis sativa]